jgi:hypothetical protein
MRIHVKQPWKARTPRLQVEDRRIKTRDVEEQHQAEKRKGGASGREQEGGT